MFKSLLTLLLSIYTISVFAGSIKGTVNSASDGKGLQGVLVSINGINKTVETNADGVYELKDIPAGKYELEFTLVSYKKASQSVTIKGDETLEIATINLRSDNRQLKDVTISQRRVTHTENAVLMEIKKSNAVVSGISAAQIGKTMDRNAADVVKRIPGVTVQDEKFIIVRGLFDRYNTVWLNDAAAPSSEVDKKSFSFDLVPSGLIDRILIYKTPSPELPGDFAGGMVKIYTTSIPEKNQYTLGFSTSFRKNTAGNIMNYNEPSKTDWRGYDDGSRALPANTPAYISKNDSTNNELTKAFGNDWIVKTRKTLPDMRFNLGVSNVFKIGRVKLGNTLGVNYTVADSNYIMERQDRDSIGSLASSYIDQRSFHSVNATIMENIGVAFGNNKIEFKNLYNQVGKSFITYRNSISDTATNLAGAADERSYIMGYESKATYCAQLSGTHKSRGDSWKYNWALGYTDLFKNQPDLRRIKYNKQSGEDDSMYKAPVAAVVDPINGGGRFYAQLYEHVYSFNHQFSKKLRISGYSFDVSVGNYIEYKRRSFSARVLGYTIKPGRLAQQLTRLPVDEIFADSNVGEDRKFKIDEITSLSDKYWAQNKLIASFVSLRLPVGQKLSVLGGVRYENNTQSLQSYINLDSVSPKVVTKFWLPSVNVSYNITDKSLVRAAYGKTLNRPEFREWSPFYFYDFDNRINTYGALYPSLAHPKGDTLDVAQVQNMDLRWEWYPATGEMIHAGVFYKSFKNPITATILPGSGDNRLSTFINAKDAYCMGLEIDMRKNLSFADNWLGTKMFKDLTFVGNLSLIKSEMHIDDTTTGNPYTTTPLQGQSPYVVNLGLFYQNDTAGLQASVLYNVFGPRMMLLGSVSAPSVYELPFQAFDITVSKTFYKHYTISFAAQNILDQKRSFVQDLDRNSKVDGVHDLKATLYKPGRYFTVGVKIRF